MRFSRPERYKPHSPTPAVAYRKDIDGRPDPFGPHDGAWIVIATIVAHIPLAEGPERRRFLDDAARMAAELFTAEELAHGCTNDPDVVDRGSSVARLRLLAQVMHQAGASHLAASLLDSLAAILPLDSLNSGRVLAQRARVALMSGKHDLAQARYEHLRRKATRLRSNELLVRSWSGFLGVAHVRGNIPAARRWANLIAQHAPRFGYRRFAAVGHQAMALVSSKARDYDTAIAHAWAAYAAREGDEAARVELLANLAQLFLEAGQPSVARGAFTRVLAAHPPAAISIPALGGYALASAADGDVTAVRWAAGEARAAAERPVRRYETASTLIECAAALEVIGDHSLADGLRARGAAIAEQGGFNELVFTAEAHAASVRQARQSILPSAQAIVATEISHLPGAEIPERLEMAAR